MNLTLPPDLEQRVNQELANGRFRSSDALIEEAVRYFLEQQTRGRQQAEALGRLGDAVDEAGLYERVLIPDQE